MPLVIVFDTNYLRRLGQHEYARGEVPEKLRSQIQRARDRGDVLLLPNTTRLETNAWLQDVHQKRIDAIQKHVQSLTAEGYTMAAPAMGRAAPPDILETLQRYCPAIVHLAPTFEDYAEAERRTCFREDPNPDKGDEEMRDRLIWCQVLRYAALARLPILFASGDSLFRNGAACEEGRRFNVSVAQTETELDQRLGDRPEHIRALIEMLLQFSAGLEKHGVTLTQQSVISIDDLRKVIHHDGTTAHSFTVRTDGASLRSPTHVTLHAMGNAPVSLLISDPSIALEIPQPRTADTLIHQAHNEQDLYELRGLIGGRR